MSAKPRLSHAANQAPAGPIRARHSRTVATRPKPIVVATRPKPIVKLARAIEAAQRRRRSDAELARILRAAIDERLGHVTGSLDMHVRDGVVTLEGDIETGNQKSIVEETAGGIAGIRSVINHMRIIAPSKLAMRSLYR